MVEKKNDRENERYVNEEGIRTFLPGFFDGLRIIFFSLLLCAVTVFVVCRMDEYVNISLIYAALIAYAAAFGAGLGRGSKTITLPIKLIVLLIAFTGLTLFFQGRLNRFAESYSITFTRDSNIEEKKQITDDFLMEQTGRKGMVGYLLHMKQEGIELRAFDRPLFKIPSLYVPLWWTLGLILMCFIIFRTLRT